MSRLAQGSELQEEEEETIRRKKHVVRLGTIQRPRKSGAGAQKSSCAMYSDPCLLFEANLVKPRSANACEITCREIFYYYI